MEIRRQIKEHVYSLFDNLSNKLFKGKSQSEPQTATKSKKKHKNKKEKVPNKESKILNKNSFNIDLLNSSLECQLGKKRKRIENNEEPFILPDFLQNKKEDIYLYRTYFDPSSKNDKDTNYKNQNLIKCNSCKVIISKKILHKEESEEHKKLTHSPEHGDASKTEDEEKVEQYQGMEISIALYPNEV